MISQFVGIGVASAVAIETEPFSDLPSDKAYKEAIVELHESEVIDGYPDGTFRPEGEVNRAEFTKILVEAAVGVPFDSWTGCFDDLTDDWYIPHVCYAESRGWIDGYSDGTFRPDQTINKAEALKILINTFEVPVQDSLVIWPPFNSAPVGPDNQWFLPYAVVAGEIDIFVEEDGDMHPDWDLKRKELAKGTHKLMTWLDDYGRDLIDLIVNTMHWDEDDTAVMVMDCDENNYELLEIYYKNSEKYVYFDRYFLYDLQKNPLHVAALNNCPDIFDEFSEDESLELMDNYQWTVLHSVALSGNVEIAEMIFDKELDVDIDHLSFHQFSGETTPLNIAIRYGSTGVAELLIENGANLEGSVHRSSPLEDALYMGNEDLVDFILENGADINHISGSSTPLNSAIFGENQDLIDLVLESGVDVTLKNHDEFSALHAAARVGNLEMIGYLVDKGLDVNMESSTVRTNFPLNYAAWAGQLEAFKLLVEYGAIIEEGLEYSDNLPEDVKEWIIDNR